MCDVCGDGGDAVCNVVAAVGPLVLAVCGALAGLLIELLGLAACVPELLVALIAGLLLAMSLVDVGVAVGVLAVLGVLAGAVVLLVALSRAAAADSTARKPAMARLSTAIAAGTTDAGKATAYTHT